ncbi:MAG: winged helix-turn-helix domain-containing protein [Elusimicrobiota bacterium]
MDSEIGITAGHIWEYLDKNGETTALKLKSILGVANTVLYMGIGWLSREGKINVVEYTKGYKISIKK